MLNLATIDEAKDLVTKEYVDGVVPSVAEKTRAIPYGVVDGTSTSTAYTATVNGIT